MITRIWPYGTVLKGKVIDFMKGYQFIKDEHGEGHILIKGAGCDEAKVGDDVILTFTQGGPTGGYWKASLP